MKRKIVVFGAGSDIAAIFVDMLPEWKVVEYSRLGCDVTIFRSVKVAVKNNAGAEAFVNFAGYCARERITGSREKAMKELSVNLIGSYNILNCVCTFSPRSKIILISSDAGKKPKPGMVMYAASKAGVISLAESVKADGYDVQYICPTVVDTKMSRSFIYDSNVLSAEQVAQQIKDLL